MSPKAADILRDAMSLSDEEREEVAARLMDTLGESPQAVEAAWNEEIARRLQEVRDGTAQTVAWKDVERELLGADDDDPDTTA